ncbi:MAG TPA: PEP-CTERM sorting domain-containing protein [Bryobacteraceae bacterium]|nr:PEP-CTERM sorting domain-containing protein [Bryobacteraceae bacterium]
MNRNNKLSWATAFAAGLLFVAAAPTARADSLLYLSDSSGNYVEVYNGAVIFCSGCTTTLAGGSLTNEFWEGTLGGWSLNIDSGVSFPPNGSPLMDLSIQNAQDTSGGDPGLSIWFASQSFSSFPGYSLVSGGSISGTMTVDASAYQGNGAATLIGDLGPTNGPIINQAGTFANPGGDASILYEIINITGAGAGSFVSDDFKLEGVPEPTSIVLLGGALLLVGRSLRRKFQN